MTAGSNELSQAPEYSIGEKLRFFGWQLAVYLVYFVYFKCVIIDWFQEPQMYCYQVLGMHGGLWLWLWLWLWLLAVLPMSFIVFPTLYFLEFKPLLAARKQGRFPAKSVKVLRPTSISFGDAAHKIIKRRLWFGAVAVVSLLVISVLPALVLLSPEITEDITKHCVGLGLLSQNR